LRFFLDISVGDEGRLQLLQKDVGLFDLVEVLATGVKSSGFNREMDVKYSTELPLLLIQFNKNSIYVCKNIVPEIVQKIFFFLIP